MLELFQVKELKKEKERKEKTNKQKKTLIYLIEIDSCVKLSLRQS